jgi:BON domain
MAQLNWVAPTILLLILTLLLPTGESADVGEPAPSRAPLMLYDLELERNIRAVLETEAQLKGIIDVSAEAAKNKITLSGTVTSLASRDKAVELAKSAHAGLVINDRIAVKPAGPIEDLPEAGRS